MMRLGQCTAQGARRASCTVQATQGIARRSALNLALGSLLLVRPMAACAAARPASEVEQVLVDPRWPKEFPFKPQDFSRYDEAVDTQFYNAPRLVMHIDDSAIAALTEYYKRTFPPSGTPGTAILDICSSWVSHFPLGYKAGRAAGLGMNADELKRNDQLTEWVVKDLNLDPKLPFEDNSFDFITNVVSVDYLTRPLEVFKEMHRCLKPGGTAIMSFSNRCFPTKAITLWTGTGDPDHVWIVGSYFHYSVPGGFTEPACEDISPKLGYRTDPMYIVRASKVA